MSTIIKLKCVDQVLAFDSTPIIASGGQGEDFVQVDFCPKWDGLVKTAVFWLNEQDAYHVLLDENDSCAIPPEVLIDEGRIYLGFFGVGDDKQRTSQVLGYNVVKGAITADSAPDNPTADLYTQLLARYLEMVDIAEDTRAKEQAFEQQMELDQETFKDEVRVLVADGLVPDGTMTTAKLQDGAVTAEKIADGAVYTPAETLTDNTKALYGLGADAVPNDVLALIPNLIAGRAQIATGSYEGTGTEATSDAPVTLTFDFEPKAIFIIPGAVAIPAGTMRLIAIRPQTKLPLVGSFESATHYRARLSWGERSVSIVGASGPLGTNYLPGASMNAADMTYYYLAIG